VQPYRPWRFGGPYRDTGFAAAAAREVYKYYYRLRYPLDVSEAGRPKRLSPLHERLESLGAVFGTKNGWERADYFRPGEPARRAGEDQRAVGWARPPWYDRVGVEHRAIRERLGIIDMTSFGKLETSDLDVLERVCDNRIDKPVGSVVYTQLVDEHGRIEGDVTVTRLAEDRFRIVTGAGAVDGDRGFLELHGARVDDVTDDYAVIGIWGPAARRALAAISEHDVSDDAFPFGSAKELEFGLAQRITYVGELGYELYVPRAGVVAVWDALVEAAAPEPVGYQALDSLRIEKGYRYFGSDMTASDTPFEAGVGFCVAKGKLTNVEREPERRLRTLVVGGRDYVTVYGGEAVHADGSVVGRVRSAAYGFTLERTIALASIPAALGEGTRVDVDVLGELVPAVVARDALYDPGGERVRS
jgi:4-methylaminobutanoate oxidase (formaldehyde-forming)